LVYDFANDINKAFTAVFPSDSIMERIINSDAKNAMLFVHHPMNWDARNEKAFSDINVSLAEIFKENNISIYNLHSPLDNY
jgi:putative NIF3 family GTP cyclohydrolase 1 type 2